MSSEGIENKVEALIEPLIAEKGLELVDVVYLTERAGWVLRIYIDRPGGADGVEGGGVTIDDITEVSRETSYLLDVEDVIPQRYMLEVSSPGLDRPLRKSRHFLDAIGKLVRIKTKEPVEGRSNFKAIIKSVSGESLNVVDQDGREFTLPFGSIARANIEIVL